MIVRRSEQSFEREELSAFEFRIKAPAKVNLSLHINGRRSDGYHELAGLVAFADIADELHFRQEGHPELIGSGEGWSLDVTGPFSADLYDAPEGSQPNLVVQAAQIFQKEFEGCCGGDIILQKNLPIAAGIGGGSSDAAATLKALQELNSPHLDDDDLKDIASSLGADVSMCLSPRAKFIRGIGDRYETITGFQPLPAVLVNPGVRVSTPHVYTELAAPQLSPDQADESDVTKQIQGILPLTMIDWLRKQRNDLQEPAIRIAPHISDALAAINKHGNCRLARMSGSGATCFGLYENRDDANEAAQKISKDHPDWWVVATMFR